MKVLQVRRRHAFFGTSAFVAAAMALPIGGVMMPVANAAQADASVSQIAQCDADN